MDQREVIDVINALNWSIGDYFILGDSALVIYGIREYCSNVSLAVSKRLYERLEEERRLMSTYPDEEGFYKLNEEVEIRIDMDMEYRMKGKFPVESIKSIAILKKERGYPKDLLDLEKMERYLKKKL